MFEGIIFTLKIPVKGKQRLETVENFRETFFIIERAFKKLFEGSSINIESVDENGQKSLEA